MSFDLRLIVISLTTYLVAGSATSLVVPWLSRWPAGAAPADRARSLFRRRLLPILVGAIATLQGIVSFVVFEPRGGDETFGLVLVGLAMGTVGLALWTAAGVAVVAWRTGRVMRGWMAGAMSGYCRVMVLAKQYLRVILMPMAMVRTVS